MASSITWCATWSASTFVQRGTNRRASRLNPLAARRAATALVCRPHAPRLLASSSSPSTILIIISASPQRPANSQLSRATASPPNSASRASPPIPVCIAPSTGCICTNSQLRRWRRSSSHPRACPSPKQARAAWFCSSASNHSALAERRTSTAEPATPSPSFRLLRHPNTSAHLACHPPLRPHRHRLPRRHAH